jgi:hypothetical protein
LCGFSVCIYGALRRFVLVGTVEPIAVATRQSSRCRARKVPVVPLRKAGDFTLYRVLRAN